MKGIKLLIQWLNIWAEQWHVVKCLYAFEIIIVGVIWRTIWDYQLLWVIILSMNINRVCVEHV